MTAKSTHSQSAVKSAPPEEWQRCSEGFKLTDSRRTTSHERVIAASGSSADGTKSNPIKSQQNFGHKWIQSEELFVTSGCSRLKPKSKAFLPSSSGDLTAEPEASESTHAKDTEDDVISWNSSDSDTGDIGKQQQLKQKQSSPPIKKPRIQRSLHKTNYSRNSTRYHSVPKPSPCHKTESLGYDSCDAISASESDEEKSHLAQSRDSASSSKGPSPVLQIECAGSPDQISSLSADENNGLKIKEAEDEEDGEGGTPSINSCVSSQATADSDVSPAQGGLRASEWAKQVKWEATPSKQTRSPPDPGDSGKKKKKCVQGGLAEQMSRIILREKSAKRMWQHQLDPADSLQGSKSMSVRVTSVEMVYSLQFASCVIQSRSSSHQQNTSQPQCLVLFSPHSAQPRATLEPGVTVLISPPWQQVDLSNGQKVLLCTRYHVDSLASTSSSQPVPVVAGAGNTCLSSSPLNMSHGRWICPCCTDGGMSAARCPAHLFPFLPASLALHTKITPCGELTRAGKALHTVTGNDGVSRRTLTFDTLLESMEKTAAGDKLLPRFQATVLRVYQEQQDAQCVRSSLLIEDSQGTVALISGVDRIANMEGRLCCFSCLRVQSRITADRDPALFSAIAGAWRVKGKSHIDTTSQDSVAHSDDSYAPSQRMIQPPSFCYLLEVDRLACESLLGDDWLSVAAAAQSPDHVAPPLGLTTLRQAMQEQNCRVSVLGKVIHHTVKTPSKVSSHEGGCSTEPGPSDISLLFVTDHTLQKGSIHTHSPGSSTKPHRNSSEHEQHSQCDRSIPAYVTVKVQQGCVTDNVRWDSVCHKSRPFLILLRDVWVFKGSWIADRYTRLASCVDDGETATSMMMDGIDADLKSRVLGCPVDLPSVSASFQTDSLACLSGVIEGVDDKSAFSWEECDGCGSDQLATKSATGLLVCLSCKRAVSSPVQRMRMDVTVRCDRDPSVTVTISLQQSTIETLLPDEEDEEGYDVDCVLQKHFGPVNCVITSATHSASVLQLKAAQLPVWPIH